MTSTAILFFALLGCQCGRSPDDSQLPDDSTPGDSEPSDSEPPDSPVDTGDPPGPGDLDGDGLPDLILAGYRTVFGSEDLQSSVFIYGGTPDGFATTPTQELPSLGTREVLVDDLDRDGHLDMLLVNNRRTDDDFDVSSWVYWGQDGQFDAKRRSHLICPGANDGELADLNGDGYLDVALACSKGGSSFVYWGSAERFSDDQRLAIPCTRPRGLAVDDLDGDGALDLVLANEYDKTGYATSSWVLLNGPDGLDPAQAIPLPTVGPYRVVVGDPNADGHKDLLFVNHHDDEDYTVDSYLYWGSSEGWSEDRRLSLPTMGASDAAFADLNGDGRDDLVFAHWFDGERYDIDSLIYWNGEKGLGQHGTTGLPTLGPRVVEVADLDLDGHLDVVLPTFCTDGKFPPEGRIFWGGPEGPTPSDTTVLEPGGIRRMLVTDANLDGWPDLIFPGYNSPCHVSAEESYVFWGGEDGYGDQQIFETPVIFAPPVVVGAAEVL
jgi:hypothetical protein